MIDLTNNEPIHLREVARHFGVSVATVMRWCKENGLEARKVGGSWRTTWEAVDEWIARQNGRTEITPGHDRLLAEARSLGLDW